MLRTRLFLNLLPFVVILLAVGSYAVILYSQLARDVKVRVAESYGSLQAAQEMSLALAGMESDAWLDTTQTNAHRSTFATNRQRFEQNLAVQLKCESLPGARELNEQLNLVYQAFRQALVRLNASTNADRRTVYQQAVVPAALKLNASLKKIRDLDHEAILATSGDIQEITRNVTRLMILGLAIALIISAYACYQLSRSILQPIQSLTQATRKLGEGEWEHPVPVSSRDELRELGTAFNKMAAQLQEYRQSTTDEIVRLHRTMETTLASFPDPIFVLDESGRIQLMNPPAQNLAASLGLEQSLPERLHAIATATLASGRDFLPHSFADVVCYRVNDGEKSFLPRVLAMRDKHDTLLGVAVVLYDVTRFRLLDAAKSNLVATVSHELKTPLTSVRMALHLLLEKNLGPLTAKQDELLQTAREDAERLLRILNDLLDLASLDEGRAELRKENVAPAELLHATAREVAETVSAHGLKLNCETAPELPAVSVDRQRIAHVFSNLVNNAIKHSPAGGQIVLRAESLNGNGVQFSISDQGPGVPEEFQTRIFDRFFRIPGQIKTGAGLGLSIAREITVAHGGRIGVKNSPGQGSTFFVVLKPANDKTERD